MKQNTRNQWQIVLSAASILVIFATLSIYFFTRAHLFMREQLKKELTAIAAASAAYIDGDVLDDINLKSIDTPQFAELVRMLNYTRNAAPNIRFVYILRATDNPLTLEFVADADTFFTDDQLDVNRNGKVDPDEEASFPGELYDVSTIPELQDEAFKQPTASKEMYIDQWGSFMSGYAPIRSKKTGEVKGVFALDMRADDFIRESYKVFSPAALIFLFGIIALLAFVIFSMFERRRIVMLEKMNAERSGLLRLTFHQLGGPLTIMKWSLETLRDQSNEQDLRKRVEEHLVCMDEGLGRLNGIIDTLQLAEKVDLGTMQYLPVPGSLRDIISNVVNEWESTVRNKNITIHMQAEKDSVLPIDRSLLTLAIRQLLLNAIEFSSEGSRIDITLTQQRNEAQVCIADTGCGIPPDELSHLFEKYWRASNAYLKKPDGNGLGLYIAKGIIDKAGGTMRVESELGKGTKVTFTLPLNAQ